MSDTVSDFMLQRLHTWGVRRIFGYPGDGINGIMGALDRAGKAGLGIEYVQTRHEELAAFMACAHAKFTGEVGVCLATSGPEAIHLLNGLYDARLDHQPVVAIVGQQARAALGGHYQQEVDLVALFKDVASEFVHMATVPAQMRHLVDRAVRIARDQRTVTCIIVPHDLQEIPAVATPPRKHGTVLSGIDHPRLHVDGRMLNLRYPMEVGLIGDSRLTLQALLPMLERKEDRGWREEVERNVTRWWKVLEARAMSAADGINPQRVFWELSPRLPDRCILTCDSGSAANWYARDLKFRRGMMESLSGGLATMGPAIPYAIAAKLAHPDRPVIALQGDGAMQMNGLNGLITIAHNWRQWRDPRLTVMVLNNGDLNQVTWEQRAMAGDPKYEASQVVPDFKHAEYARLLGLHGIRVTRPEDVGAAWDEVLGRHAPLTNPLPAA